MLKYSKMTLFTPQAYRRWFEKFLAIIVIFDTSTLKNERAMTVIRPISSEALPISYRLYVRKMNLSHEFPGTVFS